MAMPPEHLHHPTTDEKLDKNMLEVSIMKSNQSAAPIPVTATTVGSKYERGGTNAQHTCSNSKRSMNNNCSVSMRNDSNNYRSTKAKNADENNVTEVQEPTETELKIDDYIESNTDCHHRKLVSTATKQSRLGVYYSARPSREAVLQRLSEALLRRSLHKIDLSQRSLQASDAKLVKMALAQNANLTVLKLGYNNLGDLGVSILASGIVAHKSLNMLDLGFNNIGDEGIKALAHSMQEASEKRQHSLRNGTNTLHTLYLAGNLIGEDGAIAMADFLRRGSRLRKLFLTGNRIGGEGVKAVTEAILEQQETMINSAGYDRSNASVNFQSIDFNTHCVNNLNAKETTIRKESSLYSPSSSICVTYAETSSKEKRNFHGMQELYLGGTGMELIGCKALSQLLEKSSSLQVLSLPNCDIGDEEVQMLASSVKSNKSQLPIESLQLSFNNITHHGLEAIANAFWGSTILRELKVDNNIIGDRGAHQIAAILPALKVIEVLDVGFNSISAPGLTALMKTVAESKNLLSLSISGNAIDANAAKSVAYALAYNCSLKSFFLVHCSIGHEEQRHVAAGIVSNSRTALCRLNGFEVGPILLTLGFPEALKNWTNEQVFKFIRLMWDNYDESKEFQTDLERDLDPLSFLSTPMDFDIGRSSTRRSGPLEASVVVEVAKGFFDTLVANGIDVKSRQGLNSRNHSTGSPLATDAIITESPSDGMISNPTIYENGQQKEDSREIRTSQVHSFVAPPESPTKNAQEMPDPTRKKKIVEWLCLNARSLNNLAHIPFNSHELWELHQFYFTPVVKESGGSSSPQEAKSNRIISSVPEVHRMTQSGSTFTATAQLVVDRPSVPVSDPAISGPSSSTLLKRKVSYRCIGDAISCTDLQLRTTAIDGNSVARIIENGHTGHSLPPKTKKARRNRTRISFLPRIKAKLDSCLDVDHEKALVTMRQLHFVEKAILSGQVIPTKEDATPRFHLNGTSATDAEMIIVDMM